MRRTLRRAVPVAVVLVVMTASLVVDAVHPASSQTTASQPATAVWPFASQPLRFDDPVDAALSFAVEYLGFVDPVLGPFQPGDPSSGEVEVRPLADGPVTTVLLRQLPPDDSWWVLGASTPNLLLTSPAALDDIASPVPLSGQSTAFEGTVNVQIRQDDTLEPLTRTFFTGGSMGEITPFSTVVTFDAPTAAAGAIVLATFSAEDGRLWEATVVRVGLTAVPTSTTTTSATPTAPVAVVPALTG
jgi:hypothetical protein